MSDAAFEYGPESELAQLRGNKNEMGPIYNNKRKLNPGPVQLNPTIN
jgi:hypothetical protein